MDATSRTLEHGADTISLCNGTGALVRPVSPDDGVALVEFHRHLSDRTCYFRYLTPHPFLRADEVRHLTRVDGVNRAALVVEVNGALVAVGRYDRLGEPRQAKVAIVVGDAFQHQYIAAELLGRLAHLARMAGVSQFKSEVLCEDATMLSVFQEAGFALSSTRGSDTVEVTMNITSNLETVPST
jgi:N-acetylglutamate synthase-like GNAT family acetyltransferase